MAQAKKKTTIRRRRERKNMNRDRFISSLLLTTLS